MSVRYVYDRCMARIRTNIEIDEHALKLVMRQFGLKTKTEAVNLALRLVAVEPLSKEEALAMRGANAINPDWIPSRVRPYPRDPA